MFYRAVVSTWETKGLSRKRARQEFFGRMIAQDWVDTREKRKLQDIIQPTNSLTCITIVLAVGHGYI